MDVVENYSVILVDMENEVWRDIKDYEGIYEVSNFGRVRQKLDLFKNNKKGKKAKEMKIIKPDINYIQRSGYLRVGLSKCGESKHHFVHRLVAEAFMPNPYSLPYVNHKDENRGNSRLDNLEWCTQKYNSNYGTCKEKRAFTLAKKKNEGKVALWSNID